MARRADSRPPTFDGTHDAAFPRPRDAFPCPHDALVQLDSRHEGALRLQTQKGRRLFPSLFLESSPPCSMRGPEGVDEAGGGRSPGAQAYWGRTKREAVLPLPARCAPVWPDPWYWVHPGLVDGRQGARK